MADNSLVGTRLSQMCQSPLPLDSEASGLKSVALNRDGRAGLSILADYDSELATTQNCVGIMFPNLHEISVLFLRYST